MLLKIVSLFLVAVAVLGMFGKLGLLDPRRRRLSSKTCPACGRHRIGSGPCPCGKA